MKRKGSGGKAGKLIVSTATDVLTALGFPAASIVGTVLEQRLEALRTQRAERARDIALDRLRRGAARPLEVDEEDEFVAVVHRYMRAALEGTAAANLRLMANVMAGQIIEKSLYASDFQQYANVISTLTVREIVYLGNMARLLRDGVPQNPMDNFHTVEQAVAVYLRQALVPTDHFPSDEEYLACEAALQRTGLVYRKDSTYEGTNVMAMSPEGRTLVRLAEFEAVAAEI